MGVGGATLRELMDRMGHTRSTARPALIYQHATDERQRAVADAAGNLARKCDEQGRQGR